MLKDSIKLIALDIDGTLLDDSGNISDNTMKKLNELIERGIYIVLATGRTHKSADNLQRAFALDVPIISYNGGRVILPTTGEIFSSKISLENAIKILKYAEKNNAYIKAYIDDIMHIKEEDEVSTRFAKRHGIEYKVIGELSENIKEDVNMIVFFEEEEDSHDAIALFGDLDVSITRSMPLAYEFMSKGSTKGTSLKILAEHLNIKREEILAIGNALNDLEMLRFAGTGIALKNSDAALLEQWNNISEFSNNEEGVYWIIKDI